MGLVIAGMSLAVVVAFPIAGQAVVKHGSERMVWVGGVATALAVNLPVLATHPVLVAAGLFVLGGSSATMDVSMNSHGVGVERCLERPIMSSLHAGWAFGGMAGASFAALLSALGADPRVTVAIASALMLVALVASARRIGPGSEAEGEEAPRFTLPSRGVALLAALCLLVMLTEGAMADWGGLYLSQDLGAETAVAALAFAFFTAGMTVGRLFGDWINRRAGPVTLLRWGALLTGIPLAAMLLIAQPAAALIGPVRDRPGRVERRAADVQRRRPAAGHGAGARDRGGVLDGIAGLPGGPASDRVPGRRDLAPLGAGDADAGCRRGVRAGAARGRRETRGSRPRGESVRTWSYCSRSSVWPCW